MSAKRAEADKNRGERPDGEGEAKCPICGRPRHPDFRPFCSRRCADIDLSRWLSGAYVVAGRPVDETEDE